MRKFIVISYGIGFLFGLYFIDIFLNLSFYVENIHSEVLEYSSIKISKFEILVFSLFFMGILFIISVFQTKFYIKKPNDKISLYYSVYCWIVFMIIGATIFPYGNWMIVLKFVYICSIVGFIIFHHYFHAYLNKQPNKLFIYGIWLSSFVFIIGIALAGIPTAVLLFKYFVGIQFCYLFYVLFQSYIKLSEHTVQSVGNFICIIILLATSFQGFLVDYEYLDGTSLEAIGMFLFFTIHSTLSADRFLTSYSQTLEMKKLLQIKVKERTRELELANQEMQRIELEKRQTISNICHDLSNPLTSIYVVSKGLMDEIIPQNDKQFFEEIYNQSRLMEKLLTDLRQLNLLESYQLGFHMEEVEWFSFMERLFNNYRSNLQREQLSYTLFVDKHSEQELKVVIDPLRMEQVFLNLLSNSVKFTPKKGLIEVKIGVKPEDKEVYFVVSDNGVGIDYNQLPKIFDRFYRTKPIREEKDSTGIGLNIVKSIIDRHNGSIQVNSEPKKGTNVSVKIPLIGSVNSNLLSSV